MCVRFDNNVRDRIRFFEAVFSTYMPTLPSFRDTRRALTYCRIWMHLRDYQTADQKAKETHSKHFEE